VAHAKINIVQIKAGTVHIKFGEKIRIGRANFFQPVKFLNTVSKRMMTLLGNAVAIRYYTETEEFLPTSTFSRRLELSISYYRNL
jgi:hypothetical protein